MQRLADVAQVGEPAVAADLAQHPGREPGGRGGLQDGGHAAAGDDVDPPAQRLGDVVGEVVAPRVEVGRGVAEEAGERGGPHPRAAVRLLQRLQQREPLDGGRGGEHAAATGDHGRHSHLGQRLLRGGEVGVAVADDGDVATLERAAVEGRPGVEQPADVEREVAGDERPHLADGERGPRRAAELVAADRPQPQRRRDRRALQPALAVVGGDRPDDDPRVAELGAVEQLLERVEQAGVAAPVDGERLSRGVLGGGEVGGDVAAAEGVDGLLRVADQHHPRDAGEGAVEHLPLHRVGVLELVDQHDRPSVAHPGAGRGVLGLERCGEPGEQVVVRQDAEPTLAHLDLLAHLLRERDPAAVQGGAVGAGRLEPGLRVADGGARDRHRLGVGERRVALGERERAQVEVVDHLAHELVEVLDQPGARVGVARHTQRLEHERAELVGGGDGGGVEPGQRLDDPGVPGRALGVVDVEQQASAAGMSVSMPGSPPSAPSASTSCERTRSRSSWLAARPKVTTSISSRLATPSAT